MTRLSLDRFTQACRSAALAGLLLGIIGKAPTGMTASIETFNGQRGVAARVQGGAITAIAFTVGHQTVQTLHLIANPAKLAALDDPVPNPLQ